MKPLVNTHFVKFIVYFNNNQDFFECHEVLEEYWKSLPDGTKDHPLTAYILLSTGMYHWRRGNTVGALRTLKKAIVKMESFSTKQLDFTVGIDFNALCLHIKQSIQRIKNGDAFESFSIAVTSPTLSSLVKEIETTITLLPFESDAVIHKHLLRDRSTIFQNHHEKKKGRLS